MRSWDQEGMRVKEREFVSLPDFLFVYKLVCSWFPLFTVVDKRFNLFCPHCSSRWLFIFLYLFLHSAKEKTIFFFMYFNSYANYKNKYVNFFITCRNVRFLLIWIKICWKIELCHDKMIMRPFFFPVVKRFNLFCPQWSGSWLFFFTCFYKVLMKKLKTIFLHLFR